MLANSICFSTGRKKPATLKKWLFSTLIFLSASGVIAGEFDGTYALNSKWDCKAIGMDHGAWQIKDNKMEMTETNCTMSKPVNVRNMGAVLFDLACVQSEFEWTSRVMLMHTDDGLLAISKGGDATQWKRCPIAGE